MDFALQENKEDVARYAKRGKPYRGLPARQHGNFDRVRQKYEGLLREYPAELPTDEDVESALYVLHRKGFDATPEHGMMPTYVPRLFKFLSTEANRARGYIF